MISPYPAILYVEDDDNDAFLFRRALHKAGLFFRLNLVTDGLCAVEYLTGASPYADRDLHPLPQLMVVDLKMPRMSGFELLSWIRQQPTLAKLPFILLSSSNYSTDIHSALALGANGYLIKPSDSADLVEQLKDVVTVCKACNFETDGWLPFRGNQPLRDPRRDKIPLLVNGPFSGALNITARYPDN